jgi:hypothetical protein
LSLCLSHEVRFMVIGGYAVVHYSPMIVFPGACW